MARRPRAHGAPAPLAAQSAAARRHGAWAGSAGGRGWIGALALGATLGLAAASFDAAPLFVGAVGMFGLGAVARVWVGLAASRASVGRELGARRVVEDEPLSARVHAASRFPMPGGELADPLLARLAPRGAGAGAPRGLGGGAPVAFGRRRAVARIEARFARRGRLALEPPALVVRDPLGLAARTVRPPGARADDVLVLPRVEPVAVSGESDGGRGGRAGAAFAEFGEVEVDGLRPYRTGSPASRIHWASLARGADLLERRLRSSGDMRPLVVIDSRAPAGQGALDAAVRAAASLVVELARAGGCGLLLPGERRATQIERDLGAWPAAWARLALVEPGPPPAIRHVAARPGAVVWVAAHITAPPRTLLRGPGLRVLVVPGALGARRPMFEVAGCRGYAIGGGAHASRTFALAPAAAARGGTT